VVVGGEMESLGKRRNTLLKITMKFITNAVVGTYQLGTFIHPVCCLLFAVEEGTLRYDFVYIFEDSM
jgi:hypothetical protein